MYKTWHSLLLIVFTLSLFTLGCSSQDADYQVNKMDSGLKTIVWETNNKDAIKNAELRLVIKTGSLDEKDSERGFAHFVEHLAFNNTAKYPKETLFRELEAFGLSFGAHSNAQTSFDSTIYKLTVKEVNEAKLDKALEILSQWAMHVQFDQKTVDAEKGVIREEWRLRKPQEEGWQARYIKALYQSSHYENRLPIGELDVIESASAESLEAFYKRWYQPNNAALIVTGNIKKGEVNKLIKKYFSPWQQSNNIEKPVYNINTEKLSNYLSLADKKVDSNSLQFSYFIPMSRPDNRDTVYKRQIWIAGLDILDQRLAERLQETAGKVGGVQVNWNYPSPAVMTVSVGAIVPGDGMEAAIRLLTEEMTYLLKHGVTAEELNVWKQKTLERHRKYKDNAYSQSSLAVRHVMHGSPLQEQSEWLDTLEERFPKLDTSMVNAALRKLLVGQLYTLIIHNPDVKAPTETQLQQWVASSEVAVEKRPAPVVKGNEGGEWLIQPKNSGEITATRKIGEKIQEWALSNGIKVYYRYSDHQPGKVWYQLTGNGGTNQLNPQETIQARLALETIGSSGLREMNGPELNKWLTNQNLMQQPYYGFFDRGLYGRSGSEDFAKLMRLAHISLTEAKVDPKAWQHNLENNRQQLKQLEKSRTKPWRDVTDRILYNNDEAFRMLTQEELDVVKPEQLLGLYQRTFASAQNYHLAIAGDLSEEDARAAVLESIATLPMSPETDQLPARIFPRITQSEDIEVPDSGERGASMVYSLTLAKEDAGATYDQLAYIRRWLDAVLLEELREKDGLVYSIGTGFESRIEAIKDLTLTIQLACDPDKTTLVKKRIEQVLQELAKKPPEQERLLAWQKARATSLADSLQKPSKLVSAMMFASLTGLPLDKLDDVAYRTRLPDNAEQLSEGLAKLTGAKALKVWMTWLP